MSCAAGIDALGVSSSKFCYIYLFKDVDFHRGVFGSSADTTEQFEDVSSVR
jgi:hypothetical protein